MSICYLDNASTTIHKPLAVKLSLLKKYANMGRGGYELAIKSSEEIANTREVVADFFGFKTPERVVFTKNCTEAINICMLGLLNSDDHVVISNIEHNSVVRPLHCKKIDYSLALADKYGRVRVEQIAKIIKKNTKLICISHASNVLGTINNIKVIGKFAKDNNILFMVDASQTAGVIDIDMERNNIDILVLPGHKHLFGPFGTGCALINEKVKVNPIIFGGTGSNSGDFNMPDFMPDALESGTPNVSGIIALRKAIEFINKIGIKNISEHEKGLTRYLLDELKTLSGIKIYGSKRAHDRVGIVSFNLHELDSVEVGNMLAKENIAVRCGLHCSALCHSHLGTLDRGTVRASLSWWNDAKDIRKLISTLKQL